MNHPDYARQYPPESGYWPVDLHAHTTASDGTLAPEELIDLASERAIEVIGVTDHDTVAGVASAMDRARELGVTVIPGVELSTSERGAEIHVLGYGVDPTDDGLRDALGRLADGRVRRIEQMIDKLREAGYPIEHDAVMAHAEEGSVGRPHVARALIDIGAVASIDEAFDTLLKPGLPGWVPRMTFTAEEAVRLLTEHEAVPVLAHPYSTGNVVGVLRRLVPEGLRGMEVWYGEYTYAQRAELQAIAQQHDLIATGGSDYHGPKFRAGRELGTAPVDRRVVDALIEAGVQV